MPIGSRTRGTAIGEAPVRDSRALTLSATKFAYLNRPSTTRFAATANPSQRRSRLTRMAIQ
jgi:hypothetical protein